MASDNQTVIVGNLVDDPELRFTNNGTPVSNLRLAVTQRVLEGGAWRDGQTSFFRVNAWRETAIHLAESLHKGDRVVVLGTAPATLLGDPGGGATFGRRDRGRRGRGQPQVGHCQNRTGHGQRWWPDNR